MDSALWLKIYTNKQSVFMLENKQQTKKYDWILLDKNITNRYQNLRSTKNIITVQGLGINSVLIQKSY